MASLQRFSVNAIPGQINALDQRLKRVEEKLNLVLERLQMPILEQEAQKPDEKPVAPVIKTGPYVYKPLDSSGGETRILVLYSSKEDSDPVKGEILHFGLDDNPVQAAARGPNLAGTKMFKALSYTWGDMNKKCSMILDGHQFPVTENLNAALRFIRNLSKAPTHPHMIRPSFWWIDAICINQEDVLERNQQVAMMTRIYKKSFGVHIWLGPESEDSALGMDLVVKIGGVHFRGPGEPEVVYPDLSIKQKLAHWKALNALYQRPWWERVWVRQEVAIPRVATVHCGNKTCSFDQIVVAAELLLQINEQLGFDPIRDQKPDSRIEAPSTSLLKLSCYLRASLLLRLRKDMGGGSLVRYMDLRELLYHTRSCKATDTRDKVFSVLGMADPEIYDFKPDYRLSFHEILMTVTRMAITKKQNLNILSGAQNPTRENGLPSWAINLTEEWKTLPFKVERSYSDEDLDPPHFTFGGEDDSVLFAKGCRPDSIATLIDDAPKQESSAEELDAIYAKWKAALAIESERPHINETCKWELRRFSTEMYNDPLWMEFLTLGKDNGHFIKFSKDGSTPLPEKTVFETYRNPRMMESLLLPKSEDETAVKISPYRKWHELLRENGIGRKLSFSRKGHMGLVPAEAKLGDDICCFKNTAFAYIMRKLEDGKYVVVGEAYFPKFEKGRGLYNVKVEDLMIV